MQDMLFQLLLTENHGHKTDVPFGSLSALIEGIRAKTQLWDGDVERHNEHTLESQTAKIEFEEIQDAKQTSYQLTMSGQSSGISSKRKPLLEFLSKVSHFKIYTTKDDVSKEIASKLYPTLYALENEARSFLTKFFVTKIGASTWWDLLASEEIKSQVKSRKGHLNEFGKLFEDEMFLTNFEHIVEFLQRRTSGIDKFEELTTKIQGIPSKNAGLSLLQGEILKEIGISRSDSQTLLSAEDFKDKIREHTSEDMLIDFAASAMALPTEDESLRDLKDGLKSNLNIHFKAHFGDDFVQMWKEWGWLRNRICHTSLFEDSDLTKFTESAKELIERIGTADSELVNLQITRVEVEAMYEQTLAEESATLDSENQNDPISREVKSSSANQPDAISKKKSNESKLPISGRQQEILDELRYRELQFMKYDDGFVGRALFIRNSALATQRQEWEVQEILRELKQAGLIEYYKVKNPINPEFPVTAIRTVGGPSVG